MGLRPLVPVYAALSTGSKRNSRDGQQDAGGEGVSETWLGHWCTGLLEAFYLLTHFLACLLPYLLTNLLASLLAY